MFCAPIRGPDQYRDRYGAVPNPRTEYNPGAPGVHATSLPPYKGGHRGVVARAVNPRGPVRVFKSEISSRKSPFAFSLAVF